MADSLNTGPKVAEFKRLYKIPFPSLPIVVDQSSTDTYPYTPPELPQVHSHGRIDLVHDPTIPYCLINGLDQFADGLQESDLDNAQLATARQQLTYATSRVSISAVADETTVLQRFQYLVVNPLQELCRAFRLEVDYVRSPKVLNISPDHAWTVEGKPIAIFEHKSPTVAGAHFPKMVELAEQQKQLDLARGATGAESILSKLVVTSIYHEFEYCAVHSLTEFLFIHTVWHEERQHYQARISDSIPLTSSTTPIITVILALLLHSRKDDQALPYQAFAVAVANTGNVSSEDAGGSRGGASQPEPNTSPDQQKENDPSNPPTNDRILGLSPLAVSEYWEARELSQGTLALLLNTRNGISLYWDMKPFTKRVFRPLRREDSSLWNKALPVGTIPRLVAHSPKGHHVTPPPSPPMVPFVLRLDSAVGQGAVGSVYRGCFHDLSIPIIVKILPTDRMVHELEIWRRLRGLAGVGVPGLFGAYSIEGKEGREDTGVLVQQYAGRSLSSFRALNLEQRRELYRIVAKIHEANVQHGDLTPHNITLNENGGVMVLDFSHSTVHDCENENCDELRDLRQELGLLE